MTNPKSTEVKPAVRFSVREYMGTEIFMHPGFELPSGGIDESQLRPILNKNDLTVGSQILVPGLFGGYHLMSIFQADNGDLYAKGETLMAALEFAGDDRGSWVCTGLINLRGVEKLKING